MPPPGRVRGTDRMDIGTGRGMGGWRGWANGILWGSPSGRGPSPIRAVLGEWGLEMGRWAMMHACFSYNDDDERWMTMTTRMTTAPMIEGLRFDDDDNDNDDDSDNNNHDDEADDER